MTYVLILVLGISSGFGGTSTVKMLGFKTLKACEAAGLAATTKLRQDILTASFACIRKD
jgi:hypothetical protein